MSKAKWKAIALSLLFIWSLTLFSVGFLVMSPKASAQITSVSQLRDVSPTDWYYQALQSMTERYGLVFPYSDGTFRANRPGTRAEVAQLVNASMDTISQLCFAANQESTTAANLETLEQRADALALEINTLKQVQKTELSTKQ